jgi:hypothetical protein
VIASRDCERRARERRFMSMRAAVLNAPTRGAALVLRVVRALPATRSLQRPAVRSTANAVPCWITCRGCAP